MKNEEVAEFVATLFHAGTITHFQHLQTTEYSTHKALGKFYPKIVDLADQLAESYQGADGKGEDGLDPGRGGRARGKFPPAVWAGPFVGAADAFP